MYGNYRSDGGRRGGNFRGGSFSPVKVGEELDVTIEAVGEKGDGIAKKNGFVLFIPGVKQGEQVKIKVTKVLKKVGFAEVVGKGEASGEAAAEGSSGEESFEEAPAEESTEESFEESTEDSEDFGEEEQ